VFFQGRGALGHTRLSIIDLSTGGQPVFNEARDVACILNGEIYNFIELRERLIALGHTFRSTSDTEVIVHLYEELGDKVFEQLDGMFAICIYDMRREVLLVGRDRLGEKPLYFHDTPALFLCGSEIKALLQHPGISQELDPEALSAYLASLYVPAPLSIFKSIKKLVPGHYLEVSASAVREKSFWSPEIRIDESMTEGRAIEAVRAALSASVRNKLVADVPLGIFLSGGIDSSAVVAFMSRHSATPVKTYAVGFGTALSELPYARKVADLYATDHTEIVVESRLADEVPEVAAYYDEPFADTSSVPTYVISREARKHVKVVLTGDGGDELFAGYESYIGQKYHSASRLLSKSARMIDLAASRATGRTVLDAWAPSRARGEAYGEWVRQKTIFSPAEIGRLMNRDARPERWFGRSSDRLRITPSAPLPAAFEHDVNYYLPDDLLKKVDMASMAHGLETRAPFLDHRLVELALSIPPRLKLRNNVSKYLLRKAMEPDLPEGIAWREKQGFGSPITPWLNNELRPLTLEVLGESARLHAVLDRAAVRAIVSRPLDAASVAADWRAPFRLWSLLMLELWMRRYASPPGTG
jgi:asparagine synthase (glutamine-hydrolysing)